MAGVAGIVGIGSSLAGLFGGAPANNVQMPNMWQPANQAGADQNAYQQTGQLGQYNTFGQVLPQAGQIAQSQVNNPWATQALGGAQQASQFGQQGAVNQFNQGQSLYPYAQQLAQTGFDPQQALYGRTLQQTQDQIRAGEAQRGIATTPYGQGLENQALNNFNIDWQNQQLQRQNTALGGASQAIGQGAQISGQAPGMYAQSAAMPYQTYGQIGQGQLGALNTYGQFGQNAMQNPQQQIQNYLAYMQAGNTANSVANQTAQTGLNQANMGFQQNQLMGAGLGAGLQQFGRAFGSPFGGSPSGGMSMGFG